MYEDAEKMYEIRGHVLHTICAHGAKVRDLTVETALVGVVDDTDMTKDGAGISQVQEALAPEISHGPLEDYVDI